MESMNIQVNRIKMSDYEQHHYDKDLLRQSGELSNLLLFSSSSASAPLFNRFVDAHLIDQRLAPWHLIRGCRRTADKHEIMD